MALITCKECKNQVSDTAKKCPSCGAKVPEKNIHNYVDWRRFFCACYLGGNVWAKSERRRIKHGLLILCSARRDC